MKSILLHVHNHDGIDVTLQAALRLARACSAHLSCVHITPIESFMAFDSFGGVFVMKDVMAAIDKADDALKERVEKHFASEDVSWDYEQIPGHYADALVARGALADLIVVDRGHSWGPDATSPSLPLIGRLLQKARTPVYVVGEPRFSADPTGPIMIGWNGSFEAANAVRAAVGLLRLSSSVHVVCVNEEKPTEFPSTSLLRYLSSHDIHVEQISLTADLPLIAATLVGEANRLSAGLLVMGGYGHSRIREFVFGGVTREMLSHAPLPLLLSR